MAKSKRGEKLICTIGDRMKLSADEYQYILDYKHSTKDKTWRRVYLTMLAHVFDEVYEIILKENIADDKDKTLKEISKIVKETKKMVADILKPLDVRELPY